MQETIHLQSLPSPKLKALTLSLWSTSFVRGFPEPSGEDRDLQLGLGIIYGNRGEMTAHELHVLGCNQPTWAHPLCPGAPYAQHHTKRWGHRRQVTTAAGTKRCQVSAECCPQEKGPGRAGKLPSPLPSPGPSTPSPKYAQRAQGRSAEKPRFKVGGGETGTNLRPGLTELSHEDQ